MLPTYEKNARITITTGGSLSEDAFADWEAPIAADGEKSVTVDAYLKRIHPTSRAGMNPQRGVDEVAEQYLGFVWPPAKLPMLFGERQICDVRFTDGSEREGQAEITRRVISSKRLLQRMNDGGDRIEVRFVGQLRGVKP
jgi:hypothetical protein